MDKIINNLTNNRITKLNIDLGNISFKNILTICNILKQNTQTKLTSLYIYGRHNNVKKIHTVVCDMLKTNTHLKSIGISYGYDADIIDNTWIKMIINVLEENTILEELVFNVSHLPTHNIEYICNALKVNTTLKKLKLFSYYIGCIEDKIIGNMLKINTSLKSIDLDCITYNGFVHIIDALKVNTSLNILCVHDNGIEFEPEIDHYINTELESNTSITCINFYGYHDSDSEYSDSEEDDEDDDDSYSDSEEDDENNEYIESHHRSRNNNIPYVCSRNKHNMELKSMLLVDL
jgi:hypothetical protein